MVLKSRFIKPIHVCWSEISTEETENGLPTLRINPVYSLVLSESQLFLPILCMIILHLLLKHISIYNKPSLLPSIVSHNFSGDRIHGVL